MGVDLRVQLPLFRGCGFRERLRVVRSADLVPARLISFSTHREELPDMGKLCQIVDQQLVKKLQIAFQLFGLCPALRSEEHTSELQSRGHLGCRRLLENT